jgi:hypothetical protein
MLAHVVELAIDILYYQVVRNHEHQVDTVGVLNLVKTNVVCDIYGISPYRAVNTFHLGYKNQSLYAVSSTSADRFI